MGEKPGKCSRSMLAGSGFHQELGQSSINPDSCKKHRRCAFRKRLDSKPKAQRRKAPLLSPGNVDIGTRSDGVPGCLMAPIAPTPTAVIARPEERVGIVVADITLVKVPVQKMRKATAGLHGVADVTYTQPSSDFENDFVGEL